MGFLKTSFFAVNVVYQCGYVSNTGEEDSPNIKILDLFSHEPQLLVPPPPLPSRKLKNVPSQVFIEK